MVKTRWPQGNSSNARLSKAVGGAFGAAHGVFVPEISSGGDPPDGRRFFILRRMRRMRRMSRFFGRATFRRVAPVVQQRTQFQQRLQYVLRGGRTAYDSEARKVLQLSDRPGVGLALVAEFVRLNATSARRCISEPRRSVSVRCEEEDGRSES